MSDEIEYCVKLIVHNFKDDIVDEFPLWDNIPLKVGYFSHGDYFLDQFGQVRCKFSEEDQRKLISYFRSGLGFRIQYYLEVDGSWQLDKTRKPEMKIYIANLEDRFARNKAADKIEGKLKLFTVFFVIFLAVIVSLFGLDH